MKRVDEYFLRHCFATVAMTAQSRAAAVSTHAFAASGVTHSNSGN
jgi:hypothetical protein